MRKSQSLKSLTTKSDKAKNLKDIKDRVKKTIKAPYGDVRNDREMIARMKGK